MPNQHLVRNQGVKNKARLNTRGTVQKAEEIGPLWRW